MKEIDDDLEEIYRKKENLQKKMIGAFSKYQNKDSFKECKKRFQEIFNFNNIPVELRDNEEKENLEQRQMVLGESSLGKVGDVQEENVGGEERVAFEDVAGSSEIDVIVSEEKENFGDHDNEMATLMIKGVVSEIQTEVEEKREEDKEKEGKEEEQKIAEGEKIEIKETIEEEKGKINEEKDNQIEKKTEEEQKKENREEEAKTQEEKRNEEDSVKDKGKAVAETEVM